mmetsp:Transcript_22499/g.64727  ORF Transcript_22499/g.64727 Transcript_22499/m.64727 type:complete len:182 (-) Transcript_22499:106-651(-)
MTGPRHHVKCDSVPDEDDDAWSFALASTRQFMAERQSSRPAGVPSLDMSKTDPAAARRKAREPLPAPAVNPPTTSVWTKFRCAAPAHSSESAQALRPVPVDEQYEYAPKWSKRSCDMKFFRTCEGSNMLCDDDEEGLEHRSAFELKMSTSNGSWFGSGDATQAHGEQQRNSRVVQNASLSC